MKRIFYISVFFFFFVCFESYGAGKATSAELNSVSPEKTYLFNEPIQDHPRLLFSIQEEKRIKKLIKQEPLLRDLLELLKESADKLLTTPLVKYKLREKHADLLVISREHLYRIITLSLAYRMFGEIQYAKKAEENLMNVCNYPDWNPKHYLDVAEMTEAVAVGYDWLYDVLSDDAKIIIRKAIKEKALNYAVQEYTSGGSDSWARKDNNWNLVCNTGMIMGSLAIAESDPALTEKIISEAVTLIPNSLKYFAPDGVWFEGLGYWDYTCINLAMLSTSLSINFGHDYGLSDIPGINKTANFYVETLSPTGRIFNFADVTLTTSTISPVFFYFSRRFNDSKAAEYYRGLLEQTVKSGKHFSKRHFFLCIPWYDNTPATKAGKPKLQIFKDSINPLMVFKGKSSTANSIYMIAKGGMADIPHQHLDAGSFVVETNGVRWLDDPGATADDYALPGFWDHTPFTGQRWRYFRYNNFSHNTLSIDNHLQYSAGKGKILRYDTDAAKPFGIIDMTTVYINLASKVYRGFKLLSDDLMLVQDEVNLAPESKQVEWNAITGARVTVDGNTAVLQKDGKKMFVRIITPANAVFFTKEAKVNSVDEFPVSGYTLLKSTAFSSDGTNQTIRVIMSSDSTAINDTNLTEDLQPLSNWN